MASVFLFFFFLRKQPPLPLALCHLKKEALHCSRFRHSDDQSNTTHVQLLKRLLRGLELVEDERVRGAARDG